ncbi:DUF389 domain-containing protein [Arsenicicoccus sp. oral taxon 190]|uniref:DUF389 domain-containing protein n=1 Tax=Arsenicicoccus sp. oral taxon 190 TaxID=1658671 RepID=UPI0009E4F205|nr:DUF389 domain-containing protein [Arsenicicoccus sp. oral taxon 190]
MLVHLRLVVPTDLTDDVIHLLVDDPRVTNVTLERGASLDPVGDLVGADVAREAASDVIEQLEETGLAHRGGLSVTQVAGSPFAAAQRIDDEAEGSADDGVIWDLVREDARDQSQASTTYFVFLCLATALAAVAVITDSPILVVGAMVVGPDFGPVGAICAGIGLRDGRLAGRGLWLMLRGYAVAVAVVALLALLARLTGAVTPETVAQERPLTGFIWRPDLWSFVVALLAGTAGTLALTGEKSTTLVGVFISVTTVPAAGNLALALAVLDRSEIAGSSLQLLINVVGMVIAGVITVVVQRAALHHGYGRVVTTAHHRGSPGGGGDAG